MSIRFVQQFLKLESSSGIILFFMAVLSMLWANSPLAYLHEAFKGNFLFFINDGLMAIFFLLVGLELKRGFVEGPLSSLRTVMLPAVAALGGMLVPALIYLFFNADHPVTVRGWATPVPTDIAFALGVLSLFGRRVPAGLKMFLLALAIFDDVGAIVIIAFFYSQGLAPWWHVVTLGLIGLLIYMRRFATYRLLPNLIIGALLWVSIYRSGLHPTIAGVILALLVPVSPDKSKSPLHKLESHLHPWVAYLVMPLFALANAGFSLRGMDVSFLLDSVVLGIALGLFVGKQLGVFGFTWFFVNVKWMKLPEHVSWFAMYGVSLLCGIGFTMSLFLGTLAFDQEFYLSEVRMGVMLGSILSGLAGAAILRAALKK